MNKPHPATPLIEFRSVSLGYGRRVVLRDISFTISDGDYFGMVGPNGAGKTTLVRAILGSLRPCAGTIALRPGSDGPIRFGYVPQRDSIDDILPHTVGEVVMMSRYRQIGFFRSPRAADRDLVRRSLAAVGIEHLHDHLFKSLSGGQKQRALIARALACNPHILILDEPTNGMDFSSRIAIMNLIDGLHAEERLTIVLVTHLLDDVATHVSRIALVEPGQFLVGDTASVLNDGNLSSMYGMPVRVEHIKGNTIVVAGRNRGRD